MPGALRALLGGVYYAYGQTSSRFCDSLKAGRGVAAATAAMVHNRPRGLGS